MKHFLLSSILLIAVIAPSLGQSYTQFSANKSKVNVIVKPTTFTTSNNKQPVFATYTDRAAFQNDYILQTGQGLTSEDFSTGPSGINNCGTVISSNGDDCFLPGELEDGFTVTSTVDAGGGSTISISPGNVGNTIHLVGANTFAESTVVNFDPGVYAAGMDIWNESDPTTTFRVYDALGDLLEVYTLTNTVSAENFFGILANEPISRVEIEEANGGGDLIGNLEFGDSILNTTEFTQSQIAIYPNPVTTKLNINIVSSVEIEKITLHNILGKNTGLKLINGSINTSQLSTGVYILTVETSKGIISKKVIKQ
ncbi:MAG: hypothetical protein CMC14_09950 [Flavobacteriaceae bacterium]|nr:hypothetical protein [Flavobacteriaceae bacterium]|tara:strand:- start:99734 stop:100666 length:933 start_codon:yes stop_codon:yes gene_type:complete